MQLLTSINEDQGPIASPTKLLNLSYLIQITCHILSQKKNFFCTTVNLNSLRTKADSSVGFNYSHLFRSFTFLLVFHRNFSFLRNLTPHPNSALSSLQVNLCLCVHVENSNCSLQLYSFLPYTVILYLRSPYTDTSYLPVTTDAIF